MRRLLAPLLLAALALASPRSGAAACPSAEEEAWLRLAAGDAAWTEGRRGEAACAWRSLRREEDPALRAMAALRRLRTSGNLGLAVHGPRADAALAECPTERGACALARADRALLRTELGLAAEADRVLRWSEEAAALDPALSGAALVRRVQVGALPVEALQAVDPAGTGAVEAAALLRTGGGVPSPGSWTLGLGVVGAPVLGAGPVVRFVHPDVAWRGARLEAEGLATSGGALRAAVGLRTAGRVWGTAGAAASRLLVPGFDDEGRLAAVDDLWALQVRAAPGLSAGPAAAWLGPQARWDRPAGSPSWVDSQGLFGGVGLAWGTTVRATARLQADAVLLGAQHVHGAVDLGLQHDAPLGARLAWRALGLGNPVDSGDAWRRPAWGGGEVLRSAALGRFREAWMTVAVAEWRQPLAGPLGLVLFAEGGWAGEAVAGGGGGLRLHLPPRPPTTVRLDVAGGTAGWAVTAGWGEAF